MGYFKTEPRLYGKPIIYGKSMVLVSLVLSDSLVPRRPPTGKASGDIAQDARSSLKSTS